MWELLGFGRFPRAVERVGSLVLAFHAFHGPSFPPLTCLSIWLLFRDFVYRNHSLASVDIIYEP